MPKATLFAGVAIPLLLAAMPAQAQLEADTGRLRESSRTTVSARPGDRDSSGAQSGRSRGSAISSRLGGNSRVNAGANNRIQGNGNPSSSGGQAAGPNGNDAGVGRERNRAPAAPNHRQDATNNIDATYGTSNGAVVTAAPLTSGSSNEINAAATGKRDRINGNGATTGKGARPTPGTVNNPGGDRYRPSFNGNANMGDNSVFGSRGNDNGGGGNSLDTGLSNREKSVNENGSGKSSGGDNSIFGGYGNSAGAPDAGTGPEWNGNDPDAADNGQAARRGRGGSSSGGASGPNSDDKMHGAGNSGPQDPAVTEANRNNRDDARSPGGGEDAGQQDRNSDGNNTERDGGGSGSGSGSGENDNKPSKESGGAPDRPEEEFGGSGNPFSRALAGRRAGAAVSRGLGRDVTGEHREEQRQDLDDGGEALGRRRNALTGGRTIGAPRSTGTSPLLRKIVKDAQERKKVQ